MSGSEGMSRAFAEKVAHEAADMDDLKLTAAADILRVQAETSTIPRQVDEARRLLGLIAYEASTRIMEQQP